jgi:hypothetical protein
MPVTLDCYKTRIDDALGIEEAADLAVDYEREKQA